MQQISPKDRPKLIGLIVASVLVVGFGVKTTMDTMATVSGGTPAPGATPAAAVEPTAAATTATTPEAVPASYVLKDNYAASRGRDPFTVVSDSELAKYSVKIRGIATGTNPLPPARIVTGNVGVLGRNTFQELRNGGERAEQNNRELTGFNNIPVTAATPAAVPPPPVFKVLPPAPPPYAVVGVLIGEPGGRDVAILARTSGGDKKFVVEGDSLEGGYTVTAIESTGVRVTHPGRRKTTTTIPGAVPIPVGDSGEYYLPKQTTVVPATTIMLPLQEASRSGASANAAGAK